MKVPNVLMKTLLVYTTDLTWKGNIVRYFQFSDTRSTDTREVYRHLQHQLMEIISWKYGERKEVDGLIIIMAD
jgi:hypothetical protein